MTKPGAGERPRNPSPADQPQEEPTCADARPSANPRQDLISSAADEPFMLGVLQRALSALTSVPIRVTRCRARTRTSRKGYRHGRQTVFYEVTVDSDQGPRDYTLVAMLPLTAEQMRPDRWERGEAAKQHPAVRPFERVVTYIPDLQMVGYLLPADPDLPALAEMTRESAAAVLERFLPECRAGSTIVRLEHDLKHYKPLRRCVLRLEVGLSDSAPARRRAVYAKIFSDDRGASSYEHLDGVWQVAQRSDYLRVPQPFGYDRDRRMLLMEEVPGQRDLTSWIECLEQRRPLPDGVDLARVERFVTAGAAAIADLHRSQLSVEERRTSEGRVRELRKDLELVRGRHSPLARSFDAFLDRLEARRPTGEPMRPCHGAFRHKQLVGDERAFAIIDWDGLCLANPALDAASFVRRLRQEPLQYPGSHQTIEQLAEVFRRTFRGCEPEVAPSHLAWYESAAIIEMALRHWRRPLRHDGRLRCLLSAAERGLDADHVTDVAE